MALPAQQPLDQAAAPTRYLPLLVLLFIGSGCAALIYEIVWFQLLQLVIGSSAVSLGILLATFMGGMCAGSLLLPYFVPKDRHPLAVYALLELAIGGLAILVLLGLPLVGPWYAAMFGRGSFSLFGRAIVCALFLLPPTMLMGASLPAIARWVEATPQGISWLGFFYAGNLAGAVFGCLLAGFYLLPRYDMIVATLVAASINAAVAVGGLALSIRAEHRGQSNSTPSLAAIERRSRPWDVYLAIGLSGASALGSEAVWTRLLSLMLGPTVYTFSIILAVFLLGLLVGSSVGSLVIRDIRSPRTALAICQILLVGAIAWSAYIISRSLPYWPIDLWHTPGPWYTFQLDLVRCLWAILPAACLWGASFPLALSAAADEGSDAGHLVGRVYAANTLGAIVGALAFSISLVGAIGTQWSQVILVLLPALGTLVLLVRPAIAAIRAPGANRRSAAVGMVGALALLLVLFAAAARSVPAVPWELIAFGRSLPTRRLIPDEHGQLHDGDRRVLYFGEGMNASVAVTRYGDTGNRNFHVSGKVEASSEPADMRLQRMLGHLPALLHPNPRSVLIVGCGAGVTAGSFVTYPSIERIVICDIEPLIPRQVTEHFAAENYNVTHDPRVEIVYDDARHFILTTPEKFDIITSDPIHPWVKGAATLYTKEYFELVKQHLQPGGLVTQWVPLYESNLSVVQSEIATFFAAFPQGSIWSNDILGEGYDTVLLGQADGEPVPIDVDQVTARFESEPYHRVTESLAGVGFTSPMNLLSTYCGRAADLKSWLSGASINRDMNLRLQYLAGMVSHRHESDYILREILAFCHYPDGFFAGSSSRCQELQTAIESVSLENFGP